MKKFITSGLIGTLFTCLLFGCGKRTENQYTPAAKEQQAIQKTTQEKKPKKQESRTTSETPSLSVEKQQDTAQPYIGKIEADRKLLAKTRIEYKEARDKLAFLLERVDSPSPRVQMFVVRNIIDFEGPETVAALKKITTSQLGDEEMTDTPAHAAVEVLNKIESAPHLKRLSPKLPLSEQLEIIMKYAGSTNAHARGSISDYLFKEVDRHPAEFLPIILTYYTYQMDKWSKQAMIALVEKYPIIARRGFEGCMNSPKEGILEGCIDLIGDMKLEAYLPRLVALIYPDRCAIRFSYSAPGSCPLITITQRNIAKYSSQAFPFIKKMFASNNFDNQTDAIGILTMMNTPEALVILKELRDDYKYRLYKSSLVVDHIDGSIHWIEERQK